jgi:RNA polymerase sigma-70 factor (ECF subfamily)
MCRNDYRKSEVANRFNEYILKSIENYTVLNETEAKLAVCIKNLKQEQRSLIVLRFKIKLSIKEIARIFECPEGTIKSRLFYATKELSKNYKK